VEYLNLFVRSCRYIDPINILQVRLVWGLAAAFGLVGASSPLQRLSVAQRPS
jgi:hypothetical protein